MAKIPPGELQTRSVVIKWRDETENVSWQRRGMKLQASKLQASREAPGIKLQSRKRWNAQLWIKKCRARSAMGPAECHSAIQQATSLRYRGVRLRPTEPNQSSGRTAQSNRIKVDQSGSHRLDPTKWTRALPLTRPSRACGFAHIPFVASQATQVESIRVNPSQSDQFSIFMNVNYGRVMRSQWPMARWQMANGGRDAAWGHAAYRDAGAVGFSPTKSGRVRPSPAESHWVAPGRTKSNRVRPKPPGSNGQMKYPKPTRMKTCFDLFGVILTCFDHFYFFPDAHGHYSTELLTGVRRFSIVRSNCRTARADSEPTTGRRAD